MDRRCLAGHRRAGRAASPVGCRDRPTQRGRRAPAGDRLAQRAGLRHGHTRPDTIRAAETCTFVAAKPSFFAPAAVSYIGRLHVLDIGLRGRCSKGCCPHFLRRTGIPARRRPFHFFRRTSILACRFLPDKNVRPPVICQTRNVRPPVLDNLLRFINPPIMGFCTPRGGRLFLLSPFAALDYDNITAGQTEKHDSGISD